LSGSNQPPLLEFRLLDGIGREGNLPWTHRPRRRRAAFTIDPAFVITAWDPDAEDLFGWTAEQAIGRLAWEVISSDADQMVRRRELVITGRLTARAVVADRHNAHVVVEIDAAVQRLHGRVSGYRVALREAFPPPGYGEAPTPVANFYA
jgi:PAS domain S-box-containing protein